MGSLTELEGVAMNIITMITASIHAIAQGQSSLHDPSALHMQHVKRCDLGNHNQKRKDDGHANINLVRLGGYLDVLKDEEWGKPGLKGVAEELGLVDQEYHRLKQALGETRYYSWGMMGDGSDELDNYLDRLVPRINSKLSSKRTCTNPSRPVTSQTSSCFLLLAGNTLSTTSQEICNKSKSEGDEIVDFLDDYVIMIIIIIIFALSQSAKHISKAVGEEDNEEHRHHVALRCFLYALLLSPQRHEPPDAGNNNNNNPMVTKDELIRQWAAQGFLTTTSKPRALVQEDFHSKGIRHHDDAYQIGNLIVQTFQEHSVLKLPFSPATEGEEATKTAARFLAYHGLVTDNLTEGDIFQEEQWLQDKRWIGMTCKQGMKDQAWHTNMKWLSKEEEPSGTAALVLRGCSKESSWFTKLNHLLPKLPSLLVLDLSYTPVESVPPSVWCLPNIQFLSLRGCSNLETLSSFYNDERTTSQEDRNINTNLLYLDLSYSAIKSFHCALFQNIPNLQELVLISCDNLVELPPSITALSSLTKLVVTGTQIKYFPENMFQDMKNLQSLELTDDKRLTEDIY
uniref:Rx N-terminal domain-containing protein n=1 Tax=Oryza brachyantha TaxID=4533 RepID=J3LXG7_ORYBR